MSSTSIPYRVWFATRKQKPAWRNARTKNRKPRIVPIRFFKNKLHNSQSHSLLATNY